MHVLKREWFGPKFVSYFKVLEVVYDNFISGVDRDRATVNLDVFRVI